MTKKNENEDNGLMKETKITKIKKLTRWVKFINKVVKLHVEFIDFIFLISTVVLLVLSGIQFVFGDGVVARELIMIGAFTYVAFKFPKHYI